MNFFEKKETNIYYVAWANIRQRCLNPNHPAYAHYGGRGISLWQGWRDDFPSFVCYLLDELGERPEGMSLDRKDNEEGYEPGNLRWATKSVQRQNTRKPQNRKNPGVFIKPNMPLAKSGLRWVNQNNGRFAGVFTLRGERVYVGTFATPEEAHQAVLNKRKELNLPC